MPKDLLDSIIDTIIREKRKKGWVSPELMQWTADQIIKHILPADGEVGDDAPFSPGEGPGMRALTDEQRRQVQVFSGFKTYHQLSQATALLYDKQGGIRPFSAFKRDILALDQEYNVRYLKAEYELAYANIQSINTWNSFQAIKGSMPFVRYDTAHDERVREAHARMDGVIKHIDDAFWDTWWPPNGWGCRCDVAPVASDKGGKPVPPDIVPPKTMFANNVGKNGLLFPKGHPYAAQANERVRKEVEAQAGAAMQAWTLRQKPVKVSRSLGEVADSLAAIMRTVMEAADLVHLTKRIPAFAVEAATLTGGNLGEYIAEQRLVRLDPDGPWPEFTGVHELAHHIDAFALGHGQTYATLARRKSKYLNKVLEAVRNSSAYKQLQERLKQRVDRIGGRRAEKDRTIRYLRYLSKPEELFARAYAQYIAVRSASPVLTAQLETIQQLGGFDRFRQWQDADFTEIQAALDNLVKGMGWNMQ